MLTLRKSDMTLYDNPKGISARKSQHFDSLSDCGPNDTDI